AGGRANEEIMVRVGVVGFEDAQIEEAVGAIVKTAAERDADAVVVLESEAAGRKDAGEAGEGMQEGGRGFLREEGGGGAHNSGEVGALVLEAGAGVSRQTEVPVEEVR